jgi:CRP-like cAMP-binding protein
MTDGTFLERLGSAEADALAAAGHRKSVPAHTQLFEEGDRAYEVLIVESGSVKLTRVSRDGREVVVAVRGAGAILGELTAIDGGARSTSAATVTDVRMLAVPFDDFRYLIDTRVSFARALLDLMAERVRESTDRMLEFGTAAAMTRVCRRLVEFADAQAGDGDQATLAVPLTQQEIASLCGVSREAVVKALKALKDLGWIDVAGRQITVHDLDALRGRAIG